METSNTLPQSGALSAGFEPGAEIVFNTSSGISEEEQREIVAGLDALAGKGRLELPPSSLKAKAKKQGSLFPFLINGGGLLLLAAGLLILYSLRGVGGTEFQGGAALLGNTERLLIQEIRRETAGQITEKEQEIAGMTAKLEEVDAEYQSLQVTAERMLGDRERELRDIMDREIDAERARLTAQNLSEAAIAEGMRSFDEQRIARLNTDLAVYRLQLEAERAAAETELQQYQEEYRASLAALQAERAQILEAARIREANYRAQLEERIGELSGRVEQGRTDLISAQEQLRRLSDEQERAALVEGQLAGYYAEVQKRLGAGRLKEAGETLAAMRDFLNTPSFQNVRALQTRKSLHQSTIAALQSLIDETLREREAVSPLAVSTADDGSALALQAQIAVLQARNTGLEQSNQEQAQTIAAFTSEGSTQGQRLVDLQNTVTTLRQEASAREQTIVERETSAANLQAQVQSLQNQNSALETQNAAQAQQMADRNRTITTIQTENQTLQTQNTTLQTQSAAKDQQISALNQQIATLNQQVEAVRQLLLNNNNQ